MKIVKHIESLLLNENSVIVPGFGCFMANPLTARFDDVENVFLPPSRTLGFNPRVNINDSLLVQSYIDTYQMSYPDAEKEIMREVEDIKNALYNNGSFDFKGVGILSYSNGEYDFTPHASGLLTPSIYGMDALEINTLEALVAAEKSDETKVNAILKPSFVPSEEKKKSIFAKEDDEPIVITIKRSTIRKCATAAAVVAISVLSVIPMKYAATAMQDVQLASVFNWKSETTVVEKKAPAKKVVAKKVVAKKPETPKAPEAKEANYTIVLAAGISMDGAKYYAEELVKEGVAATIDGEKSPMVVFGTYANIEDAKVEIAKHLDNEKFKIAWIKKI
ncbi:MAG: hypothetical protein MJZ32_05640 [Bacteroidaceae bacterium]|nr:hypothetical protein [Bacteroidaceae bacterium]